MSRAQFCSRHTTDACKYTNGQLALFNLLKAYSLMDQDVGYCQGLSFVAGILLMHVSTLMSTSFI